MICKFAKIILHLYWKIIEIHFNWRYMSMTLINACIGVATKPSFSIFWFQNWVYVGIGILLKAVICFLIKPSSIGFTLSWSLACKDAPFWRSKITNSLWWRIRARWRGLFTLLQVEYARKHSWNLFGFFWMNLAIKLFSNWGKFLSIVQLFDFLFATWLSFIIICKQTGWKAV